MAKAKRFADTGIVEGENKNIEDDTRARALKWVQEQAEKGSEDESSGEKTVSRSTKAKASSKPASSKAEAKPAEDEPKATRTRTKEEIKAAIPTGGKPGAGPTPGNGNSVDSTELSRNASALMNAALPAASRVVKGATATAKGVQELVASRKASAALQAAREAREAKTLNPNAWMAGPKGMKENFKKGGSVKGWGSARGARKAKIY